MVGNVIGTALEALSEALLKKDPLFFHEATTHTPRGASDHSVRGAHHGDGMAGVARAF